MNLKQQLAVRLADSPLWQRWQRLAPRERLALSLLGVFLVAVSFSLGLWLPAQRQAAEARLYYQQQRELHAHLVQNTELARQMARSNRVELAPEQLQGVVTQSAQQGNLLIESFDNGSDGSLQVSLPGASYALLLRWFDELQGQGVSIAEASLERAGEGLVNARVSFRAGI
ncbi:general secretion pathway protein M [Pseudomonas sp. BAY1663]|jgi:general secretion pathway protein M|uniref:type II secretion system protein M n=1 Tax=Pseudomonas sp. BAY1663 TaxID=1439940 RepID=UPI00042E0C78|nr:type II secretion system protein M [Pseudomonas sp. BAY1663]EXF42864.1 general secretion pathway protein M [Pseudomonas sp. BAY1663]